MARPTEADMQAGMPGQIRGLEPGMDAYDRRWRVAPSGVEHIERPRNAGGGGLYGRLAASAADATQGYCGRWITHLPLSPTAGDARPCVGCLRGEYADEDS